MNKHNKIVFEILIILIAIILELVPKSVTSIEYINGKEDSLIIYSSYFTFLPSWLSLLTTMTGCISIVILVIYVLNLILGNKSQKILFLISCVLSILGFITNSILILSLRQFASIYNYFIEVLYFILIIFTFLDKENKTIKNIVN